MKLHIVSQEERTGQVRARVSANTANKEYVIGVVRYTDPKFLTSYPTWTIPFPSDNSLSSVLQLAAEFIREQHLPAVLEINPETKRRFHIRDGQDIEVSEGV